ncbi:ada2a-containing complex component 3 isoform d [Anaeramoeba ignava]|uniref:Ada2a-containing complex component 3 isoform d n=1 Tax=Anaeramoeba ignava TaxID=1746090 RepID=A0A9Q0LFG5_ANAIG|nr:ada2a-containing complex component 3 isoform d [Anaeramoeba ignava]
MENQELNDLLINACQNEYKHKNKNTFETIKYLISNGADVNFGNFYNQTPLHLICEYQKENTLKIMKYLIEKGADINIKRQYFYNQTPLHLICQYQKENTLEIIKYLIKKGADINEKTQKEEIPLHLVCQHQQKNTLEIIKYLISKGADINAKNKGTQTLLHYVCQYQKNEKALETIKYLIKKGLDVNASSKYKQTPLHFACQYQKNENSFEIIKYLIEKGADINVKNKSNKTPLHYVCRDQKQNTLEIIKYLIEKGVDINAITNEKETPLHYACKYQKHEKALEVIEYLIKNGADINAKNRYDETPLHFVCEYKKQKALDFIKLLIENGADINSKTLFNQVPLHLIFQIRNKKFLVEITKYFISKGSDINIKSNSNKLPLNYAIKDKNQKLIKLLIMNESDIPDSDTNEITKEIIDLFLKTYSINQDLNNLLNSNDNLSDFEIETNDLFKFKVHKQILLLRFDYNQSNLQKFINNCLQKPKEIVEIAINFIYTGFPNFDNFIQKLQILKNYIIKIDELKTKEEEEELKIKETKQNEINEEFFKEIGFDLNWIKSKSKRKGIIKDLSKLYEENDSKKDFTIICSEEKEIKVHKLILFLRSELFKGMFQLNIQDKSNQVHDYSRKSFETINQFIYFLYHDKIEENKFNSKIIEEFEDIKDYFQLNQNSIIDLFLNDLISSNKFKNIKKRK